MCVFGICYYSASSPIRAIASVLATADYWHLPPFGQERPVITALRYVCLELSYCGAFSPVKGESSGLCHG